MFFLPLLLLLQKLLITAGAGHTSRLNLPLTEHAVQAHDTVSSKSVVDSLELMAKVEAMAAKMEKMEEMFVRREEEMRLELDRQLKEMEQRMEIRETKIRGELDTIKEAPQVFAPNIYVLSQSFDLFIDRCCFVRTRTIGTQQEQ